MDSRTIVVKDLLGVNALGFMDEGMWFKVLKDIMQDYKNLDQTYVLDFRGMELDQPWKSKFYSSMMKDSRIRAIFDNGEIASNTRIMLILAGCKDDDKVSLIVSERNDLEQKSIRQENTEVYGDEMFKTLVFRGSECDFDIYKLYGAWTGDKTINYVRHCVSRVINERPDVNIININVGDINVSDDNVDRIVQLKIEVESNGVTLNFRSNDQDIMDMYEMYMFKNKRKRVSHSDRVEAFRKLRSGTAMLLAQYKKTRRRDDFGRSGDGEVISMRPSVVVGLSDDEKKLVLNVFSTENFETTFEYELNNCEEHPGLKEYRLNIDLEKIGIGNEFMGRYYHLVFPITDEGDERYRTVLIEDDKRVVKDLTVGEKMKAVFDSHGIQYDREELDRCIKESK